MKNIDDPVSTGFVSHLVQLALITDDVRYLVLLAEEIERMITNKFRPVLVQKGKHIGKWGFVTKDVGEKSVHVLLEAHCEV